MFFDIAQPSQASQGPLSFWSETLSILLGDVLATFFVGFVAYAFWYLLKYPGFRVGASWSYQGWDLQKMGRLPNESDTGDMELMPNVSVRSRDVTRKKVIAAVWVRERADIHDPGEIHGVLDLRKAGIPTEVRTTGGDLLSLPGPKIQCQVKNFHRIFNTPIFIQTSDGEFYKAQSPGNLPKGIVKMRYDLQETFDVLRQRLLAKLG